ncbi:hypothetical protein ACWEOH_11525 [Agromyces sp. NPDC004153]
MPEPVDVAPADAPTPLSASDSPPTPGPPLAGAAAPAAASPTAPVPGRTLGIVGFALSFLALVNVVALALSIVALVRSKRAGHQNGFAIAGIVIAGVGVTVTLLILGAIVPNLVDAAQTCAQLGTGVHEVGSSTYTCTPTSFHVFRRF